MDQGILVAVLSILVFVVGALFINYSVKRDEAKEQQAKQKAQVSELKKAA